MPGTVILSLLALRTTIVAIRQYIDNLYAEAESG